MVLGECYVFSLELSGEDCFFSSMFFSCGSYFFSSGVGGVG